MYIELARDVHASHTGSEQVFIQLCARAVFALRLKDTPFKRGDILSSSELRTDEVRSSPEALDAVVVW